VKAGGGGRAGSAAGADRALGMPMRPLRWPLEPIRRWPRGERSQAIWHRCPECEVLRPPRADLAAPGDAPRPHARSGRPPGGHHVLLHLHLHPDRLVWRRALKAGGWGVRVVLRGRR
jgi:hypothetical protein